MAYLETVFLKLLDVFGGGEFKARDVSRKLQLKASYVKNLLSQLRKRGWIITRHDPESRRKRLYRLDLGAIEGARLGAGSRYLSDYRGEYVAFLGGKAVDHDADLQALTRRVLAKYPLDELFITNVGQPKELMRIGL